MKKFLLPLFIAAIQTIAFAQPSTTDYKQRINIINKNIYGRFYDAKAHLFYETNDSSKNEHPHSYLWPLCALVQAANETDALNGTKTNMPPVVEAIKQYYSTAPPVPGYQAYVTAEKKDTRYFDDNQWVAIAYLDAYNRTREQQYLNWGKEIYTFMMTGYDTASGGGLYWNEERNKKHL